MAAKPKPPSPAQLSRAARLRTLIDDLSSGARPDRPKTPREITDEAARKKWEAAKKKKR